METFKFSVWGGHSNNVFYREYPSYEVASNVLSRYTPGYIASVVPVTPENELAILADTIKTRKLQAGDMLGSYFSEIDFMNDSEKRLRFELISFLPSSSEQMTNAHERLIIRLQNKRGKVNGGY